jgi:hypothetical protein
MTVSDVDEEEELLLDSAAILKLFMICVDVSFAQMNDYDQLKAYGYVRDKLGLGHSSVD